MYRGGFDYLYDKVGLYDTLKYISQGHCNPGAITGCWQNVNHMQDRMLNFLENHDEQRIASDFNLGNPFKALPSLAVSLMLNKAPFMLYFGQEVGESGMLEEGFSGKDGRTSIFDYCSAPSVVRMLTGKLYKSEEELLEAYREILSFAVKSKAVTCGETYDLQYANQNNPYLDTQKCFVFARKFSSGKGDESFHRGGNTIVAEPTENKDELVIVVADFSQSAESVKVTLPEHMFKFWEIPYGKLNPYEQVEIKMNKYGVGTIKISF